MICFFESSTSLMTLADCYLPLCAIRQTDAKRQGCVVTRVVNMGSIRASIHQAGSSKPCDFVKDVFMRPSAACQRTTQQQMIRFKQHYLRKLHSSGALRTLRGIGFQPAALPNPAGRCACLTVKGGRHGFRRRPCSAASSLSRRLQ